MKNCKIVRGVDSLSLIYYSKGVIGPGGTMNREASLLGKISIAIVDKTLSVNEFLRNIGLLYYAKRPRDIVELLRSIDEDNLKRRQKEILYKIESPIDKMLDLIKNYKLVS